MIKISFCFDNMVKAK